MNIDKSIKLGRAVLLWFFIVILLTGFISVVALSLFGN